MLSYSFKNDTQWETWLSVFNGVKLQECIQGVPDFLFKELYDSHFSIKLNEMISKVMIMELSLHGYDPPIIFVTQ